MPKNDQYNTLANSEEDSPVHLVISCMRGAIWIKPSRPVNRQRFMDVAYMLQSSSIHTIHPGDCGLRVMLTVDEDQIEIPD